MVPLDQLGGVETIVCLPEEVERADGVLGSGRPAERDVHVLGGQLGTQFRRDTPRLRHAGLGENGEFVTTDARELVVGADGLRQGVREPSKLGVSGGVAVRVVDQLQVVHVGKQQQERAASATATCQGIVEHACVEDAGEKVTFRELAKLSEVPPMLVREPADQEAAGGVGDEADHGRSGEDVARRQARGYHDRERVERGGHHAAQQAESCSARQRE